MTEKRFNVFDVDGTVFLEDHIEGSYHIGEKENVDIPCLNDIADRLNTYADENEQLYELIGFANTLIAFKTSESCQKEWEKKLKELKE